eukprot:3501099-Pyramimonas_sp.AAC.1
MSGGFRSAQYTGGSAQGRTPAPTAASALYMTSRSPSSCCRRAARASPMRATPPRARHQARSSQRSADTSPGSPV